VKEQTGLTLGGRRNVIGEPAVVGHAEKPPEKN
jgi:hypothetical protein